MKHTRYYKRHLEFMISLKPRGKTNDSVAATNSELRIRAAVMLVNIEITIMRTKTTDFSTINTDEFYRLVGILDSLNSRIYAPRINNEITTLVNDCQSKPETVEKYHDLLDVTQEFLDNIHH